jgi:hypothetical protein
VLLRVNRCVLTPAEIHCVIHSLIGRYLQAQATVVVEGNEPGDQPRSNGEDAANLMAVRIQAGRTPVRYLLTVVPKQIVASLMMVV